MTDLLWLNMLDLCLLVLNMLLGLQKCFLGKIEALLSGVLPGTNMRKHEPQTIKLNYKAEKKTSLTHANSKNLCSKAGSMGSISSDL